MSLKCKNMPGELIFTNFSQFYIAPKGEVVFESIPSLLKAFIHFLVFIFCKNLLAHNVRVRYHS